MKPMQWRGSRRWILGLTAAVTLAALGLVLGFAQAARADIASLDGSTKTASPDRTLPGNQLTYTIVVSNAGAAMATPITISDQLPPEVVYVSNATPFGVGFSLDPTGRRVTWTIPGGLGANAKATLGLTVQVGDGVPPGATFINTAAISDGITTIEPTAAVTIETAKYLYFPIMMKRWPPIPYASVLSLASNDFRGNYTLSWTPSQTPDLAQSYLIQEARDAAFTSPVEYPGLPLSPTSFAATGRSGTYYYRVVGVNSYGRGEWSNVVVVTSGYIEDFSNNTSGWPRTVYQWYGRNAFDVAYENNSYRAKILLNKDGNLNRIMGSVASPWVNPYNAYDVEVKHWFAEAGDQGGILPSAGKGGLIFGANADFTTIYVVEWNFEGSCSVNKYPGRSAPVSSSAIPRTIFKDWGRCTSVRTGYNQANPNTARVYVNGNAATVYINGTEIVSFTDSQLGSMHRVGILTGSWDRTPVEGRFDDFKVTSR